MLSPQAVLPTYPTLADELRHQNKAKPANIDPPRVIELDGSTFDVVFDTRESSAFGDKKPVSKLLLHNLSANPIYYCLNGNAGNTIGTYHDIIAGGTAALDGLGSTVDLSRDQPDFVTVLGTSRGDLIAVVISYDLDTFLA